MSAPGSTPNPTPLRLAARLAALASPLTNRTAFDCLLCAVIVFQWIGWTPAAALRALRADLTGLESRISAAAASAVGNLLAPQMAALQDDHAQILAGIADTATKLDALATKVGTAPTPKANPASVEQLAAALRDVATKLDRMPPADDRAAQLLASVLEAVRQPLTLQIKNGPPLTGHVSLQPPFTIAVTR